jgi:hypothetical protein
MAAARKSSTMTSDAELPAAQAVSFLRDTRSSPTWTEGEFAKAMNLSSAAVKQALPVLQLAGYIEPLARGKWRTTEQGQLVAGGKAPRFTRERVEKALTELKERIRSINDDENAPYRITEAVAFGDFLSDRVRVQAVQVGIKLERRLPAEDKDRPSATARNEEDSLLKQLIGRSTIIRLQRYQPWMSHRSHRQLL